MSHTTENSGGAGEPRKGNRLFYGAVTVSSRGQIVVPAEARKDFHIEDGDKLLVFGDKETGLWICPAHLMISQFGGTMAHFAKMPPGTPQEGE